MEKEGQGYPCCQHDMMMMMMIYIYIYIYIYGISLLTVEILLSELTYCVAVVFKANMLIGWNSDICRRRLLEMIKNAFEDDTMIYHFDFFCQFSKVPRKYSGMILESSDFTCNSDTAV